MALLKVLGLPSMRESQSVVCSRFIIRSRRRILLNGLQQSYFARWMSSSGDNMISSVEDAGRLAFKLRKQKDCEKNGLKAKYPKTMETLLSHSGLPIGDLDAISQNEPLSPPLHLASTYTRPASGDYHEDDDGKGSVYKYSRMANPTRDLFEDTIKGLELAQAHPSQRSWDHSKAITCAFSSGMATVSALVLALPQPLHIILPDDIYHGVPTVLKEVFFNRGVTYSSVNMNNVDRIEEELRSAKVENVLVWMESPSNPKCNVVDIKTVTSIATSFSGKSRNVTTVVDSTLCPPNLTQPLLLGVDAVLHSGTKYLGGHSDVLLGVITTSPNNEELGEAIRKVQIASGSNASPFDCWLTLRGLRTLHLRVERQCQTAMKIATFLDNHSLVEKVHYPGLSSHPQHAIASHQMSQGYGGMLSFEMKSEAMAMAVAGGLKVIKRATSLGGTETLIEHRASIEPEDGKVSPVGLLRVSVGLESAVDLQNDLDIALCISKEVVDKFKE